MPRSKRSSICAFRTPSPVKGINKSKHSPWTAPRARKKWRSTPDGKLPALPITTENGKLQSSASAGAPLALHNGIAEAHNEGTTVSNGITEGSENKANLLERPTLPASEQPLRHLRLNWPAAYTLQTYKHDLAALGEGGQQDMLGPELLHSRFDCSGEPIELAAASSQVVQDCDRPLAACSTWASQTAMESSTQSALDLLRPCSPVQEEASPLDEDICRSGSSKIVTATPSPEVKAPGIRTDLHDQRPPRVPTSCKTMRHVLADSPRSIPSMSAGDLARKKSGRETVRTILQFADTDDDDSPRSPGGSSHQAGRPCMTSRQRVHVREGAGYCASPDEGEAMELPVAGAFQRCEEPKRMTPNSEKDMQDLSVGQAWQSVIAGDLQPSDIDTLNHLLRSYCRVRCEPDEAEEVVKNSCRDGRLRPNSSTYHQMAALWTRHEQLNH